MIVVYENNLIFNFLHYAQKRLLAYFTNTSPWENNYTYLYKSTNFITDILNTLFHMWLNSTSQVHIIYLEILKIQ